MNKDLVLREHLAIERTRLGNERTLLAYIRTGLYFLVAGSTLGEIIETSFWRTMGGPMLVTGILITVVGVWRFLVTRRSIAVSRRNIGKASDEFLRSVREGD